MCCHFFSCFRRPVPFCITSPNWSNNSHRSPPPQTNEREKVCMRPSGLLPYMLLACRFLERESARTNERLYRRFKFKVFFITITLSPPREIHTPSRSGGRKQRKTSLIVVRPSVDASPSSPLLAVRLSRPSVRIRCWLSGRREESPTLLMHQHTHNSRPKKAANRANVDDPSRRRKAKKMITCLFVRLFCSSLETGYFLRAPIAAAPAGCY